MSDSSDGPITMQVWPAPTLRRGHAVEDAKAAEGRTFPISKELLVQILEETDAALARAEQVEAALATCRADLKVAEIAKSAHIQVMVQERNTLEAEVERLRDVRLALTKMLDSSGHRGTWDGAQFRAACEMAERVLAREVGRG